MRIEFLWIDLNGNGAAEPDEGFFRVFVSPQDFLMMAGKPGLGWNASTQCGWWNAATRRFVAASDSNTGPGGSAAAARRQLTHNNPTSRCWLGGDPTYTDSVFVPGAWNGAAREGWIPRGTAIPGAVPAALSSRADYPYLFPLSHAWNPNFKGVIHVSGDVALSGTLRGRVTVAATGSIFIADDVTYAIQPGGAAGDCSDSDMLGLFSGGDVIVADNAPNTPQQLVNNGAYAPLDDSNTGVSLHGVVLALGIFTVQNYDAGPTSVNWCGSVAWGRGCLFLSGGVIQQTRGAVGTSAGTGFLKRYSYDVCAAKKPPPYFPTTGRFSRSSYYEIDPVGFSVASFFSLWSAG